jgi:adenylate cyclase class 2
MPLEIEAKMSVPDFDQVRARLRESAARSLGAVLETNVILDSAGHDLYRAGKGLRVRKARNLTTSQIVQTVTFKGPRVHGVLKTREEIELKVDEGDAALLLEQLGFVPTLTFQKWRETWELDGCKVELDELPYLGRFVEIEGPGEEPVLAVRERLSMSGHPLIKTGYVELLMSYLETHDIHNRELRLKEPAGAE